MAQGDNFGIDEFLENLHSYGSESFNILHSHPDSNLTYDHFSGLTHNLFPIIDSTSTTSIKLSPVASSYVGSAAQLAPCTSNGLSSGTAGDHTATAGNSPSPPAEALEVRGVPMPGKVVTPADIRAGITSSSNDNAPSQRLAPPPRPTRLGSSNNNNIIISSKDSGRDQARDGCGDDGTEPTVLHDAPDDNFLYLRDVSVDPAMLAIPAKKLSFVADSVDGLIGGGYNIFLPHDSVDVRARRHSAPVLGRKNSDRSFDSVNRSTDAVASSLLAGLVQAGEGAAGAPAVMLRSPPFRASKANSFNITTMNESQRRYGELLPLTQKVLSAPVAPSFSAQQDDSPFSGAKTKCPSQPITDPPSRTTAGVGSGVADTGNNLRAPLDSNGEEFYECWYAINDILGAIDGLAEDQAFFDALRQARQQEPAIHLTAMTDVRRMQRETAQLPRPPCSDEDVGRRIGLLQHTGDSVQVVAATTASSNVERYEDGNDDHLRKLLRMARAIQRQSTSVDNEVDDELEDNGKDIPKSSRSATDTTNTNDTIIHASSSTNDTGSTAEWGFSTNTEPFKAPPACAPPLPLPRFARPPSKHIITTTTTVQSPTEDAEGAGAPAQSAQRTQPVVEGYDSYEDYLEDWVEKWGTRVPMTTDEPLPFISPNTITTTASTRATVFMNQHNKESHNKNICGRSDNPTGGINFAEFAFVTADRSRAWVATPAQVRTLFPPMTALPISHSFSPRWITNSSSSGSSHLQQQKAKRANLGVDPVTATVLAVPNTVMRSQGTGILRLRRQRPLSPEQLGVPVFDSRNEGSGSNNPTPVMRYSPRAGPVVGEHEDSTHPASLLGRHRQSRNSCVSFVPYSRHAEIFDASGGEASGSTPAHSTSLQSSLMIGASEREEEGHGGGGGAHHQRRYAHPHSGGGGDCGIDVMQVNFHNRIVPASSSRSRPALCSAYAQPHTTLAAMVANLYSQKEGERDKSSRLDRQRSGESRKTKKKKESKKKRRCSASPPLTPRETEFSNGNQEFSIDPEGGSGKSTSPSKNVVTVVPVSATPRLLSATTNNNTTPNSLKAFHPSILSARRAYGGGTQAVRPPPTWRPIPETLHRPPLPLRLDADELCNNTPHQNTGIYCEKRAMHRDQSNSPTAKMMVPSTPLLDALHHQQLCRSQPPRANLHSALQPTSTSFSPTEHIPQQ